jgi:hypothetical protein
MSQENTINQSGYDSLENYLKVSRPTEKQLENQKRNKRKSKIYSKAKPYKPYPISPDKNFHDSITNPSSSFEAEEVENQIPMRGDLNKDLETCKNDINGLSNQKFNYTLEQFGGLSMNEENLGQWGVQNRFNYGGNYQTNYNQENVTTNVTINDILRELDEAIPNNNESGNTSCSSLVNTNFSTYSQPVLVNRGNKKSFSMRFNNNYAEGSFNENGNGNMSNGSNMNNKVPESNQPNKRFKF